MTIYVVTGLRSYRGHQPGEEFEAVIDPAAEARAVKRKQIEVVTRSTPKLKKGSYRLPKTKKKEG